MNNTENVTIMQELIKRNIVKEGTSINAQVIANGLGGQPVVVNKLVSLTNLGRHKAKGWDRCDAGKDHTFNVKYSAITAVEGMDIKRMAQAYKIKFK